MAGDGPALPGTLPYPGEDHMRQIGGNVAQTAMEEFQENRRSLVAMVDMMTVVSSHLDTRVNTAESDLGPETLPDAAWPPTDGAWPPLR